METTFATRNHPLSGETYACEIDASGTIIKAAGPLHATDATDPDSLSDWIANNADTAEEDAQWLDAEIAKAR